MTYEAMVADLQHLITTQQGMIDPVLIGHSMGGKVAMQFSQTYPKVPHKLLLVDIARKAYDMTRLAKILLTLRHTPLQGLRTRTKVDQYLRRSIPEASVPLYCMKNMCCNAQGKVVWSSNIPILADSIPHLEQAVTFRAPFHKPALFINADQSDYIQAQDLALIKAMFPKYVLKRVILDTGSTTIRLRHY